MPTNGNTHGSPHNSTKSFIHPGSERYVKRPEWELYNLDFDPWKLKNVANLPENSEIQLKLKTELEKWMRQQGDSG